MVVDLLDQYEANRPIFNVSEVNALSEDEQHPHRGKTYMIGEEIRKIAGLYSPESVSVGAEDDLFKFMYSIDIEFTQRKKKSKKDTKLDRPYKSGYSLERCHNLLDMSNYLVILYPEYETSTHERKPVEIEINGYPKSSQLSRAFEFAHEWDLEKASDKNLNLVPINPKTGAPARNSKKKSAHESRPFIREAFNLCRAYTFNKRLTKIASLLTYTDTALPVERKDVLLFAYLFISGFLKGTDEVRNKILIKAKEDTSVIGVFILDIAGKLNDLEKLLSDDVSDERIQERIIAEFASNINTLLFAFKFSEFYPPFLLDRFFLFALLYEIFDVAEILDEDPTAAWLSAGYNELIEE